MLVIFQLLHLQLVDAANVLIEFVGVPPEADEAVTDLLDSQKLRLQPQYLIAVLLKQQIVIFGQLPETTAQFVKYLFERVQALVVVGQLAVKIGVVHQLPFYCLLKPAKTPLGLPDSLLEVRFQSKSFLLVLLLYYSFNKLVDAPRKLVYVGEFGLQH